MNCTNNCSVTEITLEPLHVVLLAITLSLLNFGIIFSNIFVLVSLFHGQRARLSGTRKLLINLAVSDLGLGFLVMLPAIQHKLVCQHWSWHINLCHVWAFFDLLFSTASNCNLAVIAYDQYLAVTCAMKYSQIMTGRRLAIIIAAPWTVAAMASLPIFPLGHWDKSVFHIHELHSQCAPHITGAVFRLCITVLFCISLSFQWYCYVMVCRAVMHNIRGLTSGVIQDKQTLPVQTGLACEQRNGAAQKRVDAQCSTMRVHIGRQPYYMKINRNPSRQTKSQMFSHLPGTLRCGFIIVSATIPSRDLKTGGDLSNLQVKCENSKRRRIEERRNLSAITLSAMYGDSSESGRTETSFQSSQDIYRQSLLKPFSRFYMRNATRKSDSEFSNLRSMRRCALMPLNAKMHRSVSDDITEIQMVNSTPIQKVPQVEVLKDANTQRSDDSSLQNQRLYMKRRMKAIVQMILNCFTNTVGWLPFYCFINVGLWLDYSAKFDTVCEFLFWWRFALTFFNPLIVGSASEELRRAFRVFIYCGHPKQEKKALQRLVLAGLSAAGIPYGRPISTIKSTTHEKRKSTLLEV